MMVWTIVISIGLGCEYTIHAKVQTEHDMDIMEAFECRTCT